MPALCSPLKGVTVLAHLALAASAGELSQSPRCECCTGAAVTPAAASGKKGLVKTFSGGAPWKATIISTLKRKAFHNSFEILGFSKECPVTFPEQRAGRWLCPPDTLRGS
ncbi:MAG TPA: hypothetical protein VFF88_07765 [Methylocella sp.]|nr:hypothetical protein [Methylocella sp.]